MKNFAVVLLALALAGSTVAQTRSIHAGFRANVPFDFTIGTQTFHAGTYQFQRPLGKPSTGAGVGMIAVRSLDGSAYKAVMTSLARPSGDQPADTKIVFKMHGGQWQLFQVWMGGDAQAQQLPNVALGSDAVVAGNEPEVAIAELR
jgi:hypothetical protein